MRNIPKGLFLHYFWVILVAISSNAVFLWVVGSKDMHVPPLAVPVWVVKYLAMPSIRCFLSTTLGLIAGYIYLNIVYSKELREEEDR